jgi:ankyrin repeat protein
LLLEKGGADVNARDYYNKTAFDYAKENNNQEIIDLLENYKN